MSAAPAATMLQAGRAYWAAMAPRERWLVRAALGAVMLLVLWLLALQPALKTLRQAPAQLDALDAQSQAMQRLAAETQALRATPPLSAAQASVALKAASDRLGDKAKLTMQGERAVLSVNGLGATALREWLQEVRASARARPLEATLTRSGQGFSGSIVLATGGTP
jgi:general secretion pathway protein M